MARRCVLADGDVLISRANTRELVGLAGRYASIGHPCIFPDLMMRLRPTETQCLPAYLEIVLGSHAVRNAVRAGARGTSDSMVKISAALVAELEIPLPSLEQQQRIVAAHDAFERCIEVLKSTATKRALLIDALVEQLISPDKEELAPLKTAGVEIAAGVTLGAHRVPHLRPTGYLRVANVRKGWIEGDVALLEAMERDRRRYSLTPGDLLVVEGHADPEQIGRCAMAGPEQSGLLYQNHLFRLRFDDVLPEFAMLWLNSHAVRAYWKSWTATSSGLYTINSRLLEDVPFPRVSRDEQERVVGVWKAENRALSLVRQRIAKLRLIQRAVVEDLLVGPAGASAS
ncbi:restriction endonuclease subunit S [Streptomyces scabiei]|uniref:restriction endonuclease subunit S n=1 Tax=Streptomyces scabiei TaxID=1930 RepID=UPI0029A4EB39|nr:restriction endonuclease subunit S [Streptomyces scabiei]MDX3523959.1 restriction endonuclease subunit S [Streptomyces scabiei]